MKDCLYQIGIKMHIWPTFIGLVGWLDFFANEVLLTKYQYVNDDMLWINSKENENNLIFMLTQQTNLAIEEGTSIIRCIYNNLT